MKLLAVLKTLSHNFYRNFREFAVFGSFIKFSAILESLEFLALFC